MENGLLVAQAPNYHLMGPHSARTPLQCDQLALEHCADERVVVGRGVLRVGGDVPDNGASELTGRGVVHECGGELRRAVGQEHRAVLVCAREERATWRDAPQEGRMRKRMRASHCVQKQLRNITYLEWLNNA